MQTYIRSMITKTKIAYMWGENLMFALVSLVSAKENNNPKVTTDLLFWQR
jgi:hypothetical protein